MSVRIRLARGGSKKRPFYKIVIADSRSPRDGRFIEKVGYFNPLLPKEHSERIKVEGEKIKGWIARGALPTDRVARLISEFGLCEKPAIPSQTKKCMPKAKAVERAKAKAEAEAAAKAAAEEAAKAEAEGASAAE